MKTKIESKSAPAAIGPYSQAILAGDTVYVSGMLGIDPATGNLMEGVEAQAEQALENLGAFQSALKGQVFDFATDDGTRAALAAVCRALGGEVANA